MWPRVFLVNCAPVSTRKESGSVEQGRAAALRDLEERFRLLVEAVQDYAIYMLNPDGTVASWNSGAQRIKGYAASEILGKHFSIFFTPEDVAAGVPDRQLRRAREHERIDDEGWRVRKDGSRFWADAAITALWDEENRLRGYAKVTRDLTERRQREQAERLALLHAETNRLKDEFLAIVSHELRTPLNVIVGEVWRLRHLDLAQEQQDRAWEALERNVAMQTRIIDDLLDVSRIISGKVEFEPERVDLAKIVAQAVEDTSRTSPELKVDLTPAPTEAPILGDPARLHQIFSNVLANAVKFTPAGGRVNVAVRVDGDRAICQVRDTGVGIPSEFLGRVFDRFSQADSSTRRAFGGLGLGLSIAKHLIDLHNGTIAVESEGEGRGTTFTLSFPRLKS